MINISVMPGVTCATIQIKIDSYINNKLTVWSILYKKVSDSLFTEIPDLSCKSSQSDPYIQWILYGYGPLFYDLMDLEPDTKYEVKICTTDGENIGDLSNTVIFRTEPADDVHFEFKSIVFSNAYAQGTEDDFNGLLEWFKNCMESVGYICRYKGSDIVSANIEANNTKAAALGAAGYCDGANIILKSVRNYNIPDSYDREILVHEYRHFSGLTSSVENSEYLYHGDMYGYGFDRSNNPENCKQISKVIEFARGLDTTDDDDMEIYMFYGENSVDSKYIDQGSRMLGFFLLKALNLQTIYIYT